ncbi:hemoglobin subunit alpha-3-like [Dendrobates tinctorius]|uniref:hemoglobin subunit alpha-3-like n=1 Tax=Dendrobates tinctorius TaxID=92724 RepID=UPI003CC9DCF0
MPLTESEKALILNLWSKIAPRVNDLGGEVLERLFINFPQTKQHFPNFDFSHGSDDLKDHGGKILKALGKAAHHLDDLDRALSHLSDLHNLKLDPGKFKLLSHTIKIVLAINFPNDFSPEAQAAWKKFLSEVGKILTSKYR